MKQVLKMQNSIFGFRALNFQLIRYNIFIIKTLFLIILFSSGCARDRKDVTINPISMYRINDTEWNILAGKKVFFGHQSVGNDIITGITNLQSFFNSPVLNIIETRDTSDFITPVFAHSRLGKNGDPKSKIDDFLKMLESGLGNSTDIAFMKLCYADIDKATDVNELFNYYQSSISKLTSEFPDLKIIHCTVPLTTRPKGLKGLIKFILRMDGNVYRQWYNKLLRESYSQDVIFDIAAVESTFPDGTSNLYNRGIPGLIPEYTSDGGHLNDNGSKLIAYHLLKELLTVNQ